MDMQDSKIYQLSKENIERIVTRAFRHGEDWGVTYSTWFTPTKERTEKQIKRSITNILRFIAKYKLDDKPSITALQYPRKKRGTK